MFNQQELQVLLGGVNTPVDLDDLRRNTNYGGLYSNEEPTIRNFWKVGLDKSPSLSKARFFVFFKGRRGFRCRTTSGFTALRHERRETTSSVRYPSFVQNIPIAH